MAILGGIWIYMYRRNVEYLTDAEYHRVAVILPSGTRLPDPLI